MARWRRGLDCVRIADLSLAKILSRAEIVLLRAPNHSLARLSWFSPSIGVTIPCECCCKNMIFPHISERRKGTYVKPAAWRLRGSIVTVMQAAESGLCRHKTTTH